MNMKAEGEKQWPRGQTPRGQQVKQFILQKITAGDWRPDRRVPSEAELKLKFKCARMTVHYALKELQDEGYLTRVQGLGTFVARPHVHLAVFRLTDIADDAKAAGREYSLRVLSKFRRRANQKDARIFRIRPGDWLFHSTVLHSVDGRPAQLEQRVVNAQAIPDYLERDLTLETPFSILMERVPYPEGTMTISAVVPSKAERELLRLPARRSCLQFDRITWTRAAVYTHARVLIVEPSALETNITPPAVAPGH